MVHRRCRDLAAVLLCLGLAHCGADSVESNGAGSGGSLGGASSGPSGSGGSSPSSGGGAGTGTQGSVGGSGDAGSSASAGAASGQGSGGQPSGGSASGGAPSTGGSTGTGAGSTGGLGSGGQGVAGVGDGTSGGAGGVAATGGSSTGGTSTGGSGLGGGAIGGSDAGGTATGGSDAGGGGAATGGSDAGTGGAATGGSDAGTGGAATGGTGTGGAATGGTGTGGAAGGAVTVEGRSILVGGVPFHIRGVNWNPVPRGGSHPADLDYAGFAATDIPLMRAAGINAVRTYEHLSDRAVLDQLHAAGIYVFTTVYGWWQDDPSVVSARVNAVKDHPAIMAYVLGNEWNYNHLYGEGNLTTEQTRDQINEAAALVKAADSTHPVATIYGEAGGGTQAMVQAMPDIDIWGINAYRGLSFGDLFSAWQGISGKPMFLGEYGADAFNASAGVNAYDPDSQAEATRALTQEILDNSVALAGGSCSGGMIFEFADEWWKAEGDANQQDNGGVAPGGGPYPDQTFNEEWWGVVDIDRNPRPAYDELQSLYMN